MASSVNTCLGKSVFTLLAINIFGSELRDYHPHTKILIAAPHMQMNEIELPVIWI